MYIVKFFKVSFAFILLTSLITCLSIFASAEIITGTCGVNTFYTLDTETGSFTLSGNGKVTSNPWYYDRELIQSVTIESGITGIGNQIFYGFPRIESITIPEGVTEIGYNAFAYSKIQSIVLPKSLVRVANRAFMESQVKNTYYNGELEDWLKIDFEHHTSSPAGKLYFNKKLVTNIVIPENTTVKPYSFYGCLSLNCITIPDSVTSIGTLAFSNWSTQYIICGKGSVASKYSAAFNGTNTVHHFFTHVSEITQNTATCTESGTAFFACTECSYTYSENAPATGHDIVQHEAQNPTCISVGWNAYNSCTHCEFTTYSEISRIDHTETETIITQPSATATGIGKYTCTVCGNEEERTIHAYADYNQNSEFDVADILTFMHNILNGNAGIHMDINGDGKVGTADIIRLLKISANSPYPLSF